MRASSRKRNVKTASGGRSRALTLMADYGDTITVMWWTAPASGSKARSPSPPIEPQRIHAVDAKGLGHRGPTAIALPQQFRRCIDRQKQARGAAGEGAEAMTAIEGRGRPVFGIDDGRENGRVGA